MTSAMLVICAVIVMANGYPSLGVILLLTACLR